MGLGGIGIWQMIIVLIIVLLLFGTKKLKNIGGDLGNAIKGFKKAVKDEGKEATDTAEDADTAEDKVAEMTDAAKEVADDADDAAEKVDSKNA